MDQNHWFFINRKYLFSQINMANLPTAKPTEEIPLTPLAGPKKGNQNWKSHCSNVHKSFTQYKTGKWQEKSNNSPVCGSRRNIRQIQAGLRFRATCTAVQALCWMEPRKQMTNLDINNNSAARSSAFTDGCISAVTVKITNGLRCVCLWVITAFLEKNKHTNVKAVVRALTDTVA